MSETIKREEGGYRLTKNRGAFPTLLLYRQKRTSGAWELIGDAFVERRISEEPFVLSWTAGINSLYDPDTDSDWTCLGSSLPEEIAGDLLWDARFESV